MSTNQSAMRGMRATPATPSSAGSYADIRERVQRRLLMELNPQVDARNLDQVRPALEQIFGEIMAEEQLPMSRVDRARLFDDIVADILGLGPLEAFLSDDSVSEILVNGPDQVFVERGGILRETDVRFRDAAEVMRIIDRIVAPLGRRVDESSPMVDARLLDGSRVNVIIPPLALNGPCISIRKFARVAFTGEDMIRMGALTAPMVAFLQACVRARLNILVSGGTSTGKTTILNLLSGFLPSNERIITIEDAAELQLNQRHVVRLEARPANVEGRGQVSIRQLVINALRMRPDRIIVGEVRGGEALDMLQAMNTGHDGSLTTAHSNSPRDSLRRIETMVLMSGADLPLRAVREQIASAFDLVVHLERLGDGSRKIVAITEVQGLEGDVVVMQDVFRYHQTGMADGHVEGYFSAAGIRPQCMERIEETGIQLPPDTFAVAAPRGRR